MASRASAKRYAQAVYEIALEKQELDRWQADLEKIAVLGEEPAIADLLENPRLRFENKAKVVTNVLGDISPMALNLAHILVARGLLHLGPDIAAHYQEMLDGHRDIERADVVTAVPLDEKGEQKLAEHLGAIVKKKVIITGSVEPGLIGGIITRIGGKLLDGSVRSKLAALKEELSTTPR